MKKMTTKHGHEWELPETVEEFQAAGVSLEKLCGLASSRLKSLMQLRSCFAKKRGNEFNKNLISGRGPYKKKPISEKADTILKRLSPEMKAALLEKLKQ